MSSAGPMIYPLNADETIYGIKDEKGNTIGTGTREVCEVLLYIMTKSVSPAVSGLVNTAAPSRPNLRAVIGI